RTGGHCDVRVPGHRAAVGPEVIPVGKEQDFSQIEGRDPRLRPPPRDEDHCLNRLGFVEIEADHKSSAPGEASCYRKQCFYDALVPGVSVPRLPRLTTIPIPRWPADPEFLRPALW